ncbi:MAG: hypothetical protein BVN35_14435 [Proteobacteria bacterium ST_bin11]|nr:MAG: hypothetical protein BVN35_14435 [Proteobacteria bacterium ST_bin11]
MAASSSLEDVVVPELSTQECKISVHVREEYERYLNDREGIEYKGQTHCLYFSTLKASALGMQFAFFYCAMQCSLRVLVVYETREEGDMWTTAHKSMFGNFNTSARLLLIEDESTGGEILRYTNSAITENKDQRVDEGLTDLHVDEVFTVCLIRRSTLFNMYPYRRQTSSLQPFISKTDDIITTLLSLHVATRDVRSVAHGAFPIYQGADSNDYLNVYAHTWDHLIVGSPTLLNSDHVYDLNLLSVRHQRIFLNSIVDVYGDITVDQARRVLSCTNNQLSEAVEDLFSDAETYRETTEEYNVGEFIRYFRLNDAPRVHLDNTVTVKREVKIAKALTTRTRFEKDTSSAHASTIDDQGCIDLYTGLEELRSTIDFNTQDGSCNVVNINGKSNVSALLVYDEKVIAKMPKYRMSIANTQSIITNEDNVQLKCATIIAYTMARLNETFYIVSPYISRSHSFHNLPNVRCIHPSEREKVLAIERGHTIIVFDTLFINKHQCIPYKQCKAHVIFTMFQRTSEEDELQKYIAMRPTGPWQRWMTEAPVFTGNRFDTNTNSLFNIVPAHFAFVDTGVLYPNPHALLSRIFGVFFKRLHELNIENTEPLVQMKNVDLQELNEDSWINSCCSEIVLTNEEQREFAQMQLVNSRMKRINEGSPRIPTRTYEIEKCALMQERSSPKFIETQLRLISQFKQRVVLPVFNKSIESRATALTTRIFDEEQKQRDRVLSFLNWELFPDDFRVRITCNTNSTAFISSVVQPPVPRVSKKAVTTAATRITRRPKKVNAFTCTACDFHASFFCKFERHIQTSKHQRNVDYSLSTNEQQQAQPEAHVYACVACSFKTLKISNMKKHVQTAKHQKNYKEFHDSSSNNNSEDDTSTLDREDDTPQDQVTCRHCNTFVDNIFAYQRHVLTKKHLDNVNQVQITALTCEFCTRTFLKNEDYYDHLYHDHQQEITRCCPACDALYNQSDYREHIKTSEHVNKVRYGPKQRYCEYCNLSFTSRESMIKHNESDGHLAELPLYVDTSNPFTTIEVALNRSFLAFVAGNAFINKSLFVDTHVFNLIVNAPESLRNSSDYMSLMLVTACIQPTYRNIYRSLDGLSGFVSCNLIDKVGILSAYNVEHEDFKDLLKQFINEEIIYHTNFIEYAPASLKDKLVSAFDDYDIEDITFSKYHIRGVPQGDTSYLVVNFY